MELVGILDVLRRRWLLVCLGALAGLACGLVVAYQVSIAPPHLQSRASESGVATAQVLVDTPRPLLAASKTTGDDTIAARSALLGSLLEKDSVRDEIAQGAHVDAAQVGVDDPYLGVSPVSPLARSAAELSRPLQPNVLTVEPADPRIPIVSITAVTVDPALAGPLAKSAVAALESLASGKDSTGRSPVALKVLAPVQAERVTSGRGRLKGAAVAIVVFVLWCVALVVSDRLRRRPRPGHTDKVARRLRARPRVARAHDRRRNGHPRPGRVA